MQRRHKLGTGKRRLPGKHDRGQIGIGTEQQSERGRSLTPAEIVSDLIRFGRVSLADIADMDDEFMVHVMFRPRNEHGELIRDKDDDQPIVKKPLRWDKMYKDRLRGFGLSEEQIEERWNKYLALNPGLAVHVGNLERKELKRAAKQAKKRKEVNHGS